MIDGAARRRLMVEGLALVAERHRARARDLHHVAERKMSPSLADQAAGECELARAADELSERFKGC